MVQVPRLMAHCISFTHSPSSLMCHLVRSSAPPLVWTRAYASHVNPLPQCTTLAVGYWEEPRPTSSHTPIPLWWRTLELMLWTWRSWSRSHSPLMTGLRYSVYIHVYIHIVGLPKMYSAFQHWRASWWQGQCIDTLQLAEVVDQPALIRPK